MSDFMEVTVVMGGVYGKSIKLLLANRWRLNPKWINL
jgi:hypothetical protein